MATVDRRSKQTTLKVAVKAGQRLHVLVENTVRVSFTTQIRGERAGILDDVRLDGSVLRGWETVALPLTLPPVDGYASGA